MTKALAIEYASRGIRVNAVSPTLIKTHPEVSYAGLEWQIPLGRIGEIHDVVAAVMYLEERSVRNRRDFPRRWRPERRPLVVVRPSSFVLRPSTGSG